MIPLSVVICCANVGDTLHAACGSVRPWVDDLVVVDSGSSDETPAIAHQFADRYIVEPWRGYTPQKKYGTSLARHDWVLILDGDEEVTPPLAREIQNLMADAGQLERRDVFAMRRQTWALGRPARGWWPDWQRRLIHRQRAIWPPEIIHDDRLPSSPQRLGWLQGKLDHKRTSARGFRDLFSGQAEDVRMPLMARELHRLGRRCHWWDLALRPPGAFFKSYVLKGGFRDGAFGLIVAQGAARSVQLKYAALWAAQQGQLGPATNTSDRVSLNSGPAVPRDGVGGTAAGPADQAAQRETLHG